MVLAKSLIVAAAVVAAILAGCSAGQIGAPPNPAAPAQIAATDWTGAKAIDLMLTEFAFEPRHIALLADQPYRLRLQNRGSDSHSFAAPEFFESVAWRDGLAAAEIDGGGSVELPSGTARDLYLVPRQLGIFPVECSHFLHSALGMTGNIVVEQSSPHPPPPARSL